ncbi:hypothetical protein CEXT_465251 [Caerostris extrusa]|uniref:Uncharacterized protein n=1 Tax=Caerostris extrusa TaxID=172846 RepID=A0AAV4PCY0_CAEEX|nr:hypothetical protein CEXT_465251 [Caerostris extrusa]
MFPLFVEENKLLFDFPEFDKEFSQIYIREQKEKKKKKVDLESQSRDGRSRWRHLERKGNEEKRKNRNSVLNRKGNIHQEQQ